MTLPRKQTKYTFPPPGYRNMTQEQNNEVHDMLDKRPLPTELQTLAQKENFALFILASVNSQLVHLSRLKDAVIDGRVRNIELEIAGIKHRIKVAQSARKEAKETKK